MDRDDQAEEQEEETLMMMIKLVHHKHHIIIIQISSHCYMWHVNDNSAKHFLQRCGLHQPIKAQICHSGSGPTVQQLIKLDTFYFVYVCVYQK